MRLPQFLKSLVGCVDPHSSRYALGAVFFEHEAGVTTATATDGRQLVSVSYADVNEAGVPSGTLVEGASLAKAFGVAGRKAKNAKPTTFKLEGSRVMLAGPGGEAVATTCEGRFPRYRDVFSRDGAADTQVLLCPEILGQALKVFADAGVASVRFHVKDNTSGVMLSGQAPTGEVIRSVVMPRAAEDGSGAKVAFPAAFSFKASDAKPTTVVMKPVVGPSDAKAKLAAIAAKAS